MFEISGFAPTRGTIKCGSTHRSRGATAHTTRGVFRAAKTEEGATQQQLVSNREVGLPPESEIVCVYRGGTEKVGPME